jgi:hypothetical protein
MSEKNELGFMPEVENAENVTETAVQNEQSDSEYATEETSVISEKTEDETPLNCDEIHNESNAEESDSTSSNADETQKTIESYVAEFNDEDTEKILEKKKKKKITTIICIVAAVVVFGIAAIIGVSQYKQKKAEKEYAERLDTYSSNLSDAASAMLNGAVEAEKCANLICDVWYNAIHEIKDTDTDKYTRSGGRFVDDFEDALENLISSVTYRDYKEKIETYDESVNTLMKKLVNPPDEYETAYDKLLEFYDAYVELIECAIDPSGSYNSFSDKFGDADDEIVKTYNALKIYLDN